MLEVRLLGPVEVWVGDRRLPIGEPRQRTVLAALAADAGRVVSVDTLIDRVWGDRPPDTARQSLQSHLARVRAALRPAEAGAVVRRSGGYLFDLDTARVDLVWFRALVVEAQAAGAADRRAALLFDALGLWRGEPLAGVSGDWAGRMRTAWERERLIAVVAWAEAELTGGRPAAVVGPLSTLAAEQPLVESVAVVLMRALHATGRATDALDHYSALRRRLADELGTDPAPETRAVHAEIIAGGGPPVAVRAVPAEPVPAQLPADVAGFTGRAEPLALLDALLPPGDKPAVVAIFGSAGVGKTALAVHWAHRAAGHFPDGRLYVDLRGFGPAGTAMDQGEAVRRFLVALGVEAPRIPAALDEQAALLRSRLAGRRLVLVLDNALNTDQVRPLLPGAGGCVVLVTSRNQLTGLVATGGAQPLRLDVLSRDEARDLLGRRLGTGRLATDPTAADAIIGLCAGLPLALALAAANAAMQPRLDLAAVADGLADTRHRWVTLSGDTVDTDLRAVFSWSYRAVTPPAARLFRLLGAHPGPDISDGAAAALAGEPARPLLTELVRSSLLTEHVPGRYAFHDLMRVYAEQVEPAGRDEAFNRLLEHYLRTAYAAAMLLAPDRVPILLPVEAETDVKAEPPADQAAAMRWFAAERPVLLALAARAADTRPWQLAWTLDTFLYRQGPWHDLLTVWQAALSTVSGPRARAYAHGRLARAYTLLDRGDDADRHYRRALARYRQAGDRAGQAAIHHELAILFERQGRMPDALAQAERALELAETRSAGMLNTVGFFRAQLGDFAGALRDCTEALALYQDGGSIDEVATVWDSLGFIRHGLREYDEAVACYDRALELYREVGDRYWVADTLTHLGDTYQVRGRTAEATTAWREALEILEELGHSHAAGVRERLAHR